MLQETHTVSVCEEGTQKQSTNQRLPLRPYPISSQKQFQAVATFLHYKGCGVKITWANP